MSYVEDLAISVGLNDEKCLARSREHAKYATLWRRYNEAAGIKEEPRMGIRVCGMCYDGEIPVRPEAIRHDDFPWETVGGHTAGFSILAVLMHMFFPDFLSAEELSLILKAVPFHDYAEVKSGDTPDDGTQTAEKARFEEQVLREYCANVPNSDDVLTVLRRAEQMKGRLWQDVIGGSFLDVTAWKLKALDKAEAVLQLGRYKKMGATARIGRKIDPSAQDLQAVETLGTDDAVFVWAWNSSGFLKGTELWKLMTTMMLDTYDESDIPIQFLSPDF